MRQRYIQSFNTAGDEQSAIDDKLLGKPYVALIHDGAYIDWYEKSDTDYSKMPLTFEIISGGVINWRMENEYYTGKTIEYSLNDGEWIEITASYLRAIKVNDGDIIKFKGDNSTYGNANSGLISKFKSNNVVFNIYGNIMSLITSDGFTTATTLQSTYTFLEMFENCTGLTSAKNLVLPATSLKRCCYKSMFGGCTSLTEAPELPATSLVTDCYDFMFNGCTNLNYIKCLAIPSTAAVDNWVSGVAASGTFVKHPNASWARGTSGIPNGWTVIDAE